MVNPGPKLKTDLKHLLAVAAAAKAIWPLIENLEDEKQSFRGYIDAWVSPEFEKAKKDLKSALDALGG